VSLLPFFRAPLSVDNTAIIRTNTALNADSLPYFASNAMRNPHRFFGGLVPPYFSAAIDFDLAERSFPDHARSHLPFPQVLFRSRPIYS
jgi:hypothetical protein